MVIHNVDGIHDPRSVQSGDLIVGLREGPQQDRAFVDVFTKEREFVVRLFEINQLGIVLHPIAGVEAVPPVLVGQHGYLNIRGPEGILHPIDTNAVETQVQAVVGKLTGVSYHQS